ncbi:hypothetical protein [Pseudomonas putida]
MYVSKSIVAAVVLCVLAPAAFADTHSQHQSQVGVTFQLPFGQGGINLDNARVGLAYQHVYSESADTVYGGAATVTTSLHSFDPRVGVQALGGDRDFYAGAGVSYGTSGWGVPVSLHAPFVEVGLDNIGELGGFYGGVNTMNGFKKYQKRDTVVVQNFQ